MAFASRMFVDVHQPLNASRYEKEGWVGGVGQSREEEDERGQRLTPP